MSRQRPRGRLLNEHARQILRQAGVYLLILVALCILQALAPQLFYGA